MESKSFEKKICKIIFSCEVDHFVVEKLIFERCVRCFDRVCYGV